MAKRKHQWQIDLEKEQERLRNRKQVRAVTRHEVPRVPPKSDDDLIEIFLGNAPQGFPFAHSNAKYYD
jgi:hypothetical protein